MTNVENAKKEIKEEFKKLINSSSNSDFTKGMMLGLAVALGKIKENEHD